jgi:hypothetical protein
MILALRILKLHISWFERLRFTFECVKYKIPTLNFALSLIISY